MRPYGVWVSVRKCPWGIMACHIENLQMNLYLPKDLNKGGNTTKKGNGHG